MLKDKRDICKEFMDFCHKNFLVENETSASYFAEKHLNKETKINAERISKLYAFASQFENK